MTAASGKALRDETPHKTQASVVGRKNAKNAGIQDLPASGFRALIELPEPFIQAQGKRHRLSPGMQVNAEINLGTRTVLQYLLSPVQKTLHEAGRER